MIDCHCLVDSRVVCSRVEKTLVGSTNRYLTIVITSERTSRPGFQVKVLLYYS